MVIRRGGPSRNVTPSGHKPGRNPTLQRNPDRTALSLYAVTDYLVGEADAIRATEEAQGYRAAGRGDASMAAGAGAAVRKARSRLPARRDARCIRATGGRVSQEFERSGLF